MLVVCFVNWTCFHGFHDPVNSPVMWFFFQIRLFAHMLAQSSPSSFWSQTCTICEISHGQVEIVFIWSFSRLTQFSRHLTHLETHRWTQFSFWSTHTIEFNQVWMFNKRKRFILSSLLTHVFFLIRESKPKISPVHTENEENSQKVLWDQLRWKNDRNAIL